MEWIKANPDEAAQLANKPIESLSASTAAGIDDIQDGWFADGRLPQKGLKIFWEIAVQFRRCDRTLAEQQVARRYVLKDAGVSGVNNG